MKGTNIIKQQRRQNNEHFGENARRMYKMQHGPRWSKMVKNGYSKDGKVLVASNKLENRRVRVSRPSSRTRSTSFKHKSIHSVVSCILLLCCCATKCTSHVHWFSTFIMCNQMYFTCSLIFILLLNWGPASARKLSEGPGECNCALFANDVKKVLKWQDFRPADRNQSKAEACTGSLETGSCQREKHKANCGNKNLLLICLTQISCKSAGVWGLEWIRFLKLLKLGLVVCPEQQKNNTVFDICWEPQPPRRQPESQVDTERLPPQNFKVKRQV